MMKGITMRRRRALVVDDESMVRAVFRRWLEREMFQVIEAESFLAATDELLRPGCFDVVITDYRMPGHSGADLVAWIRAQRFDVPILLVSAYSEHQLELTVRPDHVLEKPVTRDQLLTAVTHAMALVDVRASGDSAEARG